MENTSISQGENSPQKNSGEFTVSAEEFKKIQKILLDAAGISLRDNRSTMVQNRIYKRTKTLGMPDCATYVSYLETDLDKELGNLINALTTNVTHFFREGHHFEHLEKEAFEILKSGTGRIRIWSAACSIGAEPYSAAIALTQAKQKASKEGADIKILATDVDTLALRHAREGVYKADMLKNIPKDIKLSAFSKVRQSSENKGLSEEHYKASDSLRKMISFNFHNFNEPTWPMKGPFDFIFCRNALIYFERPKQIEFVNKMAALLRPGGFFYLGHSETVLGERPDFKNFGKTTYQKIQT
jgi:chemotaxis protein methyltransferase CheR